MVAVGRALLSDHEWVIKMKEGRLEDINPYTKDSLYRNVLVFGKNQTCIGSTKTKRITHS